MSKPNKNTKNALLKIKLSLLSANLPKDVYDKLLKDIKGYMIAVEEDYKTNLLDELNQF